MTKTDSDTSVFVRDGETIDEMLGGRIGIIQKKKGYRFSLDAILLSHFVRLRKRDHVVDLGTGSGVIAIIIAQRGECGRVIGIDIQEELVDMAKRSVLLNNLTEKVDIYRGDIKNIETLCAAGSFDVAIFNPPYRKLKSGRINPDKEKSIARHEIKANVRDFLKASGYVLKKSGRAFIIYPATRIAELLSSMKITAIEPKRMRMVHSHGASKGEFVLVEGIKNAREELEVMPPLFVYSDNGEYTESMSCIFNELSDSVQVSS